MTVESVATYNPRMMNAEVPAEVIDFDMMKAILYLGIKGEVQLPIKENHTIDTFA